MNKKITLLLVTAFLLACNAIFPKTPKVTAEPLSPPQTGPITLPTEPVDLSTEPASQSEPAVPASTGFTTVRLHPDDGDLKTLLAQEAQKAIALGQMPVVEFDATWCPACRAIDEGLESKDEQMLKAYAGTYLIKLDVDEWGWGDSSLHDFNFDGIPVYFKLDAQGHQTGEIIDGNAWGDNIPENIAPPMDKFFHSR